MAPELELPVPEPEVLPPELEGPPVASKAAPTVWLELIANWQVPVPEHAPDQPANVLAAAAVAVNDTVEPGGTD